MARNRAVQHYTPAVHNDKDVLTKRSAELVAVRGR